MPIDLCREELDIYLKGTAIRQYSSASSNNNVAVLSILDPETKLYKEVGRTELVRKNNSPEFVDSIRVIYLFETIQKVKITFYNPNVHELPEDLSIFPVLGEAYFTLSKLFESNANGKLSLTLSNGGTVEIRGTPVFNTRDLLQFKLHGDLVSGNWVNNPNPSFLISRVDEDGQWVKVIRHRNPTVRGTTTPDWGQLEISIQKLCNGSLDCPLRFEIFDDINHQLVGEIREISINQILNAGGSVTLPLRPHGTLTFEAPALINKHTFLDYLNQITLSLVVGIDFSRSNGDPSPYNPDNTTSLHFIDPTDEFKYNIYQECIQAVGHIILQYDTDKLVPVYGFGAKVRQSSSGRFGPTSHCFPLASAEVNGVEGILEAYKNIFNIIQLAGPTLLEPIVKKAADDARRAAVDKLNYTVLLIITDGDIQDMVETTRAVIEASSAPLSIIILGVGSGDFTNMEILDSDGTLLSDGTHVATRDIVQFVKFSPELHPTLLAEYVLQEIPQQVIEYYDKLQKDHPDLFSEPL